MNSPMLPSSLESQSKTFWNWVKTRPEGKLGLGLLVLAAILLLMGWAAIASFLVGMLVDTLHIIGLGAITFASLWVVFSKRSHLLFRLLSRKLTGLIIELDPVGIAKDRILQMKKRRANLDEQLGSLSGQKSLLERTIQKNTKDADDNLKFAAKATEMASSQPADAFEMQLQARAKANRATRLQKSNLSYQQLLDKITKLYGFLRKLAVNTDFFIEDTEDNVKQAEIERKTVRGAWNAFRSALSIIKGDPEENDMADRAMEAIAEDVGMKLGEIEHFQEIASNFMTSMDIQNAVVDTNALEALDKYEQKLLTAGAPTLMLPAGKQQPEAVPVKTRKAAAESDYGELLK